MFRVILSNGMVHTCSNFATARYYQLEVDKNARIVDLR